MSFGISIIKNPVYIWDQRRECNVIDWNESQGDYNLEFEFDYNDFSALQNFIDIKLSPAKQREGENYPEYEERLKNEYLDGAKDKGYEMLGRIWYWYESVCYLPSEINRLFQECVNVKNDNQNLKQVAAIEKLIFACKEAKKIKSGIFLGSD